jgi:hypothetical protein
MRDRGLLHSLPRSQSNLQSSASRGVDGIASYRFARAHQIADRVASVAIACGSVVARRVSDKMRECAKTRNIWTARDLHNADGELFDGVGTYIPCGVRLCPSCSASLRRRARRRARVALASCALRSGEHARFITLTMPTIAEASLLETIQIVHRAWSLMRKRKFWKANVRAGIKGVEFTVTPNGYHTHIHILCISKWIEYAGLRSEWSHCLRSAWRASGREIVFKTSHGEAVVDVRLVKPKMRASASRVIVSLESALQEVCKYITKSESWDALPDAHLVEIAEVRRWPRLFEVFGEMRAKNERPRVASVYVHTPNLSDAAQLQFSFESSPAMPSRARPPTLRDLMDTLDRQTWLAVLSLRFARGIAYRRSVLCRLYPYAVFRSLDGVESSGALARPI